MSFILDALRKSENERQRQASPHVAVTANGANRRWQPGWVALVLTGLGTAVLAVAIVWWVMEPGVKPVETVAAIIPPANETIRGDDPVVRSLAQEARRTTDSGAPQGEADPASAETATAEPSLQQAERAPRGEQPLTVIEAMAAGLSLPHMNLDIHVFAPQPAGRFVFINARKYREGEVLREGPRLEEITSDGVILTFQGQRLLLPRD